jgi:hypothetical protein
MYRRSKFLEALLGIRREMALEADYDVELFVARAHKENSGAAGKPLIGIDGEPCQIDTESDSLPAGKQLSEVRKP